MFIARSTVFFMSVLSAVQVQAEVVDPTLPIDFAPPAVLGSPIDEGVNVHMILVRGGQAIALVNGRYVHVNDQIGNAKVIHIGKNYVELQGEGGTIKHYLAGYDFKTVREK